MRHLPSGTVTVLFTDIEGSTRLLDELGHDRFDELLGDHRRILREAFAAHHGVELRTEGDSFFAAFERASDAVAAAADAQAALGTGRLRVRIGLHTGEPLRVEHEDGYVGIDVHRGARIAASAHGGQVVLSQATRILLDPRVEVRDLGVHRLKDLTQPERLYQLGSGDFPPLRTVDRTNLPVPATPLVGRDRELGELESLLRRGEVRLVTVTGPPGTGKTRLVLAQALDRQGDFADGVFFVDLAPLADPTLVSETIAQAIGAEEPAGRPTMDRLREYLAEKRLLLVLDNFEHVLDAAPAVNELLAAGPGVKVLATSRARLHLAAEHEFPLAPLVEDEAVQLFVERALAAQPGFGLNGNRELVTEICRKLEGLPLAVELAAARVKVLSLDSLLARLAQRLPLLTTGARGAPARQQTMRATIEWSYELLGPAEQHLVARLSVFVGGCTLEAAEEICDADLDTLGSLVDKSLLRLVADRFVMLDTIREYAHEQLQELGEAGEAQARHADYYVALAESAQAPGLSRREEQAAWLERLAAEHENLRVALAWSLEEDPEERAMRLGAALAWYFNLRKVVEGRQWLGAILARGGTRRRSERSEILAGAGQLAQAHGDFQEAERLLRESLEERERAGDELGVARSLYSLGWLALHQGDYTRARVELEQSLALRRQTDGDGAAVGATLNRLGVIALYEGDFAAAEELWRECLSIARARGDLIGQAAALGNLSLASVYRGDFELAVVRGEEGLALFRRVGDPEGTIDGLDNLGRAAIGVGDFARAHELFAQGLAIAYQVDYKWGVAECLEGLAAAAAGLCDDERAAWYDGAASALRTMVGAKLPAVDRPDRDRRTAEVSTRLGEEAWSAARARGAALTVEQAVELALERPAAAPAPT